VIVTVGREGAGDCELWFFVPSSTTQKQKQGGTRHIQYLNECTERPGHYQVDAIVDTTSLDTEELYKWPKLEFESRKVKGEEVVTTLRPLDDAILKKMQKLVDERNQTLKKKRRESWLNNDSDSSSTEDDSDTTLNKMRPGRGGASKTTQKNRA
jgi:hypothetical protein